MNASIYKTKTNDQSPYFIKLKRGHHHDISATTIALLHDAGIQQIILLLKIPAGNPFSILSDFTLIVPPFIEGQDGFNRQTING